jgi:hypothetical protein
MKFVILAMPPERRALAAPKKYGLLLLNDPALPKLCRLFAAEQVRGAFDSGDVVRLAAVEAVSKYPRPDGQGLSRPFCQDECCRKSCGVKIRHRLRLRGERGSRST